VLEVEDGGGGAMAPVAATLAKFNFWLFSFSLPHIDVLGKGSLNNEYSERA
jgi:hypothetical protein